MSAQIAVALLHYPILNRLGKTATTAITSIDIHDFARTAAFFDVAPVYFVHPASAMQHLFRDIQAHWQQGAGGERNAGRKTVMQELRLVDSLQDILDAEDYQLWYTSATPPDDVVVDVENISKINGKHLIVFGTGSGLDVASLPKPKGWLSPVQGVGRVRHLSVRGALSIYLDRLRRSDLEA